MSKKRYGIDLDGVCFNFTKAFTAWLKRTCDVEYSHEEITSYYWHECIDGLSEATFWKEFDKFGMQGHGYRHLELLPGTVAALDTIIAAGHEIVFITNRPEYARQDTIDAIEEAGFPKEAKIIFAKGNKAPIIQQLSVDVFIDDSPKTVEQITTGTRATVYCRDAPYNRELDDSLGWFTRVCDWSEFLEAEGLI